MIDHYLFGSCSRISPEAPVQVVDIKESYISLGGAGNVVKNLISLGCKTSIVGVVGDDLDAGELKNLFVQSQVDTSDILEERGRKTSKKTRVIAAHQHVVRYDNETVRDILPETEQKLKKLIIDKIPHHDLILLSDYGKGLLTESLCQTIIEHGKLHNKKVLVDPKGLDYSKYSGCYLLKPNKKEASAAVGIEIVDDATLKEAGFNLRDSVNAEVVVITLAEEGMAIFSEDFKTIEAQKKDVFDVTGAGDTVLASLSFAVANGLSTMEACQFATYAAAIVISKVGSATVTLEEIDQYIAANIHLQQQRRIMEIDELKSALRRFHQGEKIVAVVGAFNQINATAVKKLERAKSEADVLIIGVTPNNNSSEWTDNIYMLSSLRVVDYVIPLSDKNKMLDEVVEPQNILSENEPI